MYLLHCLTLPRSSLSMLMWSWDNSSSFIRYYATSYFSWVLSLRICSRSLPSRKNLMYQSTVFSYSLYVSFWYFNTSTSSLSFLIMLWNKNRLKSAGWSMTAFSVILTVSLSSSLSSTCSCKFSLCVSLVLLWIGMRTYCLRAGARQSYSFSGLSGSEASLCSYTGKVCAVRSSACLQRALWSAQVSISDQVRSLNSKNYSRMVLISLVKAFWMFLLDCLTN